MSKLPERTLMRKIKKTQKKRDEFQNQLKTKWTDVNQNNNTSGGGDQPAKSEYLTCCVFSDTEV